LFAEEDDMVAAEVRYLILIEPQALNRLGTA
jgi:hypothetical protein